MIRRLKLGSHSCAYYHCMTRTVNGARLFGDREKEILRKMIWQLADFSGLQVLTYCVMSNHFHVLLRVPPASVIPDAELLRRYRVLYAKPTEHQIATLAEVEKKLALGGEAADELRRKLQARMGDISEYMKAVKQRFSVWYNRSHGRFGTLWAERFKSVLVEGRGNPLQTMAAYIDLNPLRAGLVQDPKDYRFCGYAEAVAGAAPAQAVPTARDGIHHIWGAYAGGAQRDAAFSAEMALQAHRELLFGKRAAQPGLSVEERRQAVQVLEQEDAMLPKATVLRCRVRYFTDGAILGSQEFVRSFVSAWQVEKQRKYPPKVSLLRGADWNGLAMIQGLNKCLFR